MKFWRQVWVLAQKDLQVEVRSKEVFSSTLFFSFLVIVIFAFAFNPTQETTREVFPGMVWVAFTFSGVLGLNRGFVGERANETLMGLMLSPMDRSAIFFGKALANLIFMVVSEAVTLPLFLVLFDLRPQGSLALLLLVVLLGTLGFVSVGTFLSALAANARSSEILLPLILFPVAIPVLIAAVEATGQVLAGATVGGIQVWLELLLAYDLIFIAVSYMLFDYVLEV